MMKGLFISLLLFLLFSFASQAQTNNKFQKKISSFLSKDEVVKAEEYCEQQKTKQERAECYTILGDNSLNELEYSQAMTYYLKAENKNKQYQTLLKASESNSLELVDNLLIRNEKEKQPGTNETELQNNAFMPIAEICYAKKDYKNAGYYYQKAGVKKLSIECKVLHAINTKDYITVVELSESENIGLRNTMDVYKHAADQYFAKADYENASKCYDKTGNNVKVKLCFEKDKEREIRKSLVGVCANIIEFSDLIGNITTKLDAISNESAFFEKVSFDYKENGYIIESENSLSFSKLLKKLLVLTLDETFLVKPIKKESANGEKLLKELWSKIQLFSNSNTVDISSQKQQTIVSTVKQINTLKENFFQEVKKTALKQQDESGISKLNSIYQIPSAIESEKEIMEDYFASINAKETSLTMSWMIFSITKIMYIETLKKLDEIKTSSSSNTHKKIDAHKKSFIDYYKLKINDLYYLKSGFKAKSWSEFIMQKMLKDLTKA